MNTHQKTNILICMAGLTPQIITETIYALGVNGIDGETWIPDEVKVITTQDGFSNIDDKLFEQGNFKSLIDEYADLGLNKIKFSVDDILLIKDNLGNPIKDLITEDDNLSAGDLIHETIKKYTQDDNVCLHVSIAGGRKTMAPSAIQALSFFGRPRDKASHVLVSEPFEQTKNFYFPAREPKKKYVQDRDFKSHDSFDAHVTLSMFPYPRLNKSIKKNAGILNESRSQVINSINMANQELKVILNDDANFREDNVFVNGKGCHLSEILYLFYKMFVIQKKLGKIGYIIPRKKPEDGDLIHEGAVNRLNEEIEKIGAKSPYFNNSKFNDYKTNIKKRFIATYGIDVAEQLMMHKQKGDRFELILAPENFSCKIPPYMKS